MLDPGSLLERAAEANRTGRPRRAIQLCNVGLNAGPSLEVEHALREERATAYVDTNAWSQAERDCRRVLESRDSARAHGLLARSLIEQGQTSGAIAHSERALANDSQPSAWWQVLARALTAEGRHDAAVEAAWHARQRDPGPKTRTSVVQALAAARRDDEIIEFAQRELESAPDDASLWSSLGLAFNARGRSEEAVTAFRRAVTLAPERVEARCGLGMALLRLGQFEEGFRHHEHRQRGAGDCRRYAVAPWKGEPLDDKHLVIWSEQGYGDTIQFARFVPLVRRRAQRTTLFAAPPILRLFRSSPELGRIESRYPGFGSADYQVLLMSLPHVLRLGSDLGCGALPLFTPEPERVRRWRARLPPGPKVALCWQGNPKYGGEPWRSMPFAEYEPLIARYAGQVTFVSVQKYFGSEQLRASRFADRVIDLSSEVDTDGDAFVDSLAVLSLMDVFLTTDTGIAHLAGSTLVPSWVLLSEVADWRWGIGTETCRWYPSLRLFRQSVGADWKGVVRRVSNALEEMIAKKARCEARGFG